MTRSLPRRAAVPIGRCDATAVAWQLKGEIRVTAIVKATFALVADAPMTRVDARPIARDDVHHGGNAMRSIVLASDLAPYKKRADVLFTGQAHAPPGAPAPSMTVRLGVLDGARALIEKALVVRKKGGFDRLRLLYEHAVGGPHVEENPFGEDPDDEDTQDEVHVFDPSDASRPAGFAPVPRRMMPRKRLLGALPMPSFGPEIVQIPDAFSFDFFQVAPADQRTDFLRGDEQIVLGGLHPSAPVFRSRLPGCRAVARVHGLASAGIQEGTALAMYADTLHVSGDEERCHVVWRGTFAVPAEAALAAVRIAAGVETPGEPVIWPSPAELEQAVLAEPPPEVRRAAPRSAGETLQLSDDDIEVVSSSGAATLPLTPAAALAAAVTPFKSAATIAAAAAPSPRSPIVKVAPPAGTETLPVPSSAARAAQQGAPLPFRPAAPGASAAMPAPAEKRRSSGSAGETLPLPTYQNRSAGPALPFGASRPTAVSPGALPASKPETGAASETAAAPPPAAALSQEEAASPPPAEAPAQETGGSPPQVEAPAATPSETASAPAPAAPAPSPATSTARSVWAAEPEAAPAAPAPPPAPKKLPPKVDVRSKLYGSNKKGR